MTAPLGDTISSTATVTVPDGAVDIDATDDSFSDVNTAVMDGLHAYGFATSVPLIGVPI